MSVIQRKASARNTAGRCSSIARRSMKAGLTSRLMAFGGVPFA